MGKFNLLTTLSLNAAGMSEGLQKAVGDIEKYVEDSKGKNSTLSTSFRDVAEMGVGDLRKEIKQLNNQSFVGKSPEQIQALKMRIGELRDTMGDLKNEQKMLGTELGTAMAGGLRTISAVAESVVGVASLFGVSKEKAEQYQQAMVALIGVTQGMGVVQDALETRQMQNIALKIQDTAVTMAQSVATGVVTAAQWLFNAALVVTVAIIGAAVIVVAAIVAGIYLLTQSFAANRDELEKQTKAYEDLDAAHRRQNDTNALNIKIMKARGATETEIAKQELTNAKNRQTQINAEMDALGKLGTKSEEQQKKFKELGDEYIKNGDDIIIKNIEVANSGDKHSKAAEKQAGAYELLKSKLSDTEEKIKNILATGGTVSPEMLAKLNEYKSKLEGVEKAIAGTFAKPHVANIETNLTGKTEIPTVHTDKKGDAAFLDNLRKRHAISNKYTKLDLDAAKQAAKEKLDYEMETRELNTQSLADSFGRAASLFGENTIAYKAMAIAQATISTWLAGATILANTAKLGPVVMAAAFASTIATGLMTVGKIAGAFAGGGIVGGSSYSGDALTANVNSAEMILNQSQQGQLFALANGRGGGNNGGEVTFRIEGTTLVGVLNNHSKKMKNTR